jgi:phosphomannomutase
MKTSATAPTARPAATHQQNLGEILVNGDPPSSDALTAIVKAYDIRGLVGTQLTEAVARAIGRAFAGFVREHPHSATEILVAHDMRDSSSGLSAAFAQGAATTGTDVLMIGLSSTDMLYFASGQLNLPGAMFTASHNPAAYNGIKLCLPGARPISLGNGLDRIRDAASALLRQQATGLPRDHPAPVVPGRVRRRSMLEPYAQFLGQLVDLSSIRRLRVVVDAGNGMAGLTVPAVLGTAPLAIDEMYFELDGTFPNHEANPLDPANLVDLQAAVRANGADIGLAFDGDADRCFVVDERGEPVSPSSITALVATRELRRRPGSTVLYNLISSRAVPEIITENGGRAVRTRVGHSFIKSEMASTGAIFGGEHSAHYYFADFFGADTGMLAAMHVLAALGKQNGPLSQLVAGFGRYHASGEINSTVTGVQQRLTAIRTWAADRGAVLDGLDGLTATLPDGSWFNVRASNTEPLLRLNVEAETLPAMGCLRDRVLELIRA